MNGSQNQYNHHQIVNKIQIVEIFKIDFHL
jgi:hypothetical protein